MTPERRKELERELELALSGLPVTDANIVAAELIEAGYRFVGAPGSCCVEVDTVRRMREHLAEVAPERGYRIIATNNVPFAMVEAGAEQMPMEAEPRGWSATLGITARVLRAALEKAPT